MLCDKAIPCDFQVISISRVLLGLTLFLVIFFPFLRGFIVHSFLFNYLFLSNLHWDYIPSGCSKYSPKYLNYLNRWWIFDFYKFFSSFSVELFEVYLKYFILSIEPTCFILSCLFVFNCSSLIFSLIGGMSFEFLARSSSIYISHLISSRPRFNFAFQLLFIMCCLILSLF